MTEIETEEKDISLKKINVKVKVPFPGNLEGQWRNGIGSWEYDSGPRCHS